MAAASLACVGRAEPWGIVLEGFPTPAWVIYAALRFWQENPEHLEELGTTFAQRRIERWCAFAASQARDGDASEMARGA